MRQPNTTTRHQARTHVQHCNHDVVKELLELGALDANYCAVRRARSRARQWPCSGEAVMGPRAGPVQAQHGEPVRLDGSQRRPPWALLLLPQQQPTPAPPCPPYRLRVAGEDEVVVGVGEGRRNPTALVSQPPAKRRGKGQETERYN
ncbi:hypothetical protein ABZP36_025919 [Zizania latifolia]